MSSILALIRQLLPIYVSQFVDKENVKTFTDIGMFLLDQCELLSSDTSSSISSSTSSIDTPLQSISKTIQGQLFALLSTEITKDEQVRNNSMKTLRQTIAIVPGGMADRLYQLYYLLENGDKPSSLYEAFKEELVFLENGELSPLGRDLVKADIVSVGVVISELTKLVYAGPNWIEGSEEGMVKLLTMYEDILKRECAAEYECGSFLFNVYQTLIFQDQSELNRINIQGVAKKIHKATEYLLTNRRRLNV